MTGAAPRRVGRAGLVLVAAAALAGCIPWQREVLVQPALEFLVVDPQQRPLPGARILFVAGSNPHHVLHHTLRLETDQTGRAAIEAQRETETIYPLMMHGVPFYYWTWCVELDGYAPAVHEMHDPKAPPLQRIVLEPGAGGACRESGGRIRVD
jgi:hypothetical protein